MDNLGSHKGKVVRALIRSRGAKLFFLPKYPPDLDPIEQVFAKLKHPLRKVAARPSRPSGTRSVVAPSLHTKGSRSDGAGSKRSAKKRICPINQARCLRKKTRITDDLKKQMAETKPMGCIHLWGVISRASVSLAIRTGGV